MQNALDPMERAIGYITRQPLGLLSKPPHQTGSILVAVVGNASPIKLRTSLGDLWITIAITMRIVNAEAERERYRLSTISYVYSIAEDQESNREILAYHWTRDARPPLKNYPHLHIGASVLNDTYRTKPWSMQKRHVRTERISIDSFVYMLITEFGVKPNRSNWRAFLESSHQDSIDTE